VRRRPLYNDGESGAIRPCLRIVPDREGTSGPNRRLPPIGDKRPALALDAALAGNETHYGSRTANMVAMQLACTRHGSCRCKGTNSGRVH
jgi:hypothetical protein